MAELLVSAQCRGGSVWPGAADDDTVFFWQGVCVSSLPHIISLQGKPKPHHPFRDTSLVLGSRHLAL